MTAKKGFKETEIGRIPSEWNVGTVDEFCNVVDCRHVTAEFVMSGTPVASIGEVQSRYVNLSSAKQTTDEFYDHLVGGGRKPQPGDLIFSRNATVGEVAQVTESHPPFAMGQDVCLIRKKDKEHSSDYLQSVIRSNIVTDQLENMMVGSTFRRVNVRQIKSLIVPVPKPEEQRAIAEALSDVDALINALDALITKKRHIKQGTMQQLLTGKKRLPGFGGTWEEKKIQELGSTYGGITGKSKADFGCGDAKYVTFMNVMSNVVIDCKIFESVNISTLENQNRVMQGDLLFNGSSETPEEVAMCSVIPEQVADLYLNSFCFGFRFHNDVESDGLFIAYYLRSLEGRELMKSLAQGSTRFNLSKRAFLASSICIPCDKEQKAIAEVLSDMDAEITALEQKRDKTKLIKQGMMQELLTGKTRLTGVGND